MEYVRLGTTGLKVSRIGLGTMSYGTSNWREWVLDEEESLPFYRKALEHGINFFDTADMYSLGASEEVTGKALSEYAKRDEVVIATKVYNPMSDEPNARGLSRKHIIESIDASLRRLRTDYVDLYWIHRWDYETPIEETLEALNDVVRSGKARYIGASSMFAWQLAKALGISRLNGWSRFVAMQNHYNLLYREEEREMLPLCVDQGIGVTPWSPLARGLLTGKRKGLRGNETTRARTDDNVPKWYARTNLTIVERLVERANKLGHSPARTALAWLLRKPAVAAPIVGATKLEHLDDLVGAVDVALSDDDMHYLEELYEPQAIQGHQ